MSVTKRNHSPHVIEGLDAIAAYMGKSRITIWRWIQRGWLPAGRLPDGTWFITPSLIDRVCVASHDGYISRKAKRAVTRQLDIAS
jgi:hypothetical protein